MAEVIAPVTKRIELLDIIRGFALVGIIYANILSWSGLKFLPIESIKALGNFEMDVQLYRNLKFFVDTKFYTIFSLLFGIGFSLQIIKNKDNPSFPPLYRRRLVLLFSIGMIHAFFWSGDILMLYALMGFVILSLRNLSQENTLKAAILLFIIPLCLDIVYMYTFAPDIAPLAKTALKVYPDRTPEEIVAGFESTHWLPVLKTNFHNLIWRWYDFIPSGRPFKVLGLFLFGSYLYSSGYFIDKVYKAKTLLIWMVLGVSFTALSMNMNGSVAAFSTDWSNWLYKLIHEVGQITLALSYISLIGILFKAIPKFFAWDVLKNYGRMSLTSYIGHSLLGILAFYPVIAFGYFGKLDLEEVYIVATILLVIQLLFSTLWFKWFQFGPIEWAWRCLTYKKLFSILKKSK